MVPDFKSRTTLLDHIRHTKQFYDQRCVDPSGGLYHFYKDDGTVYDTHTRHLVSSTRFVFNYAMAFRRFGDQADQQRMLHGLAFLRSAHRNAQTGGYAWQLDWHDGKGNVTDGTNHCYGLAFVLLAYSHALMAGVDEARLYVEETFALMERRFWEPQHGLYADEASADWSTLDPYRGQNANMHACEALIAAFEATGDNTYIRRAETLARNITLRQASLAGDIVWEHYHADWTVDPDYNRHDSTNIFRPWGYQPGHLTEWSKLLLILERHQAHLAGPADWLLPRASSLFLTAMGKAWDHQHGGLHYGFAPDGSICDPLKYFWVQAESLAAAAVLGGRTGEAQYWDWYQRIWAYSWEHFVDHRHGAWYRILSAENGKLTDEKSPAGKVDYHTMGACYEVLHVLEACEVGFPEFIAAGEALTDMIAAPGQQQWASQVGGSTWNVARAMARLGVPSAFAGAVSGDVFGDQLWTASQAAALDMRFMQRVARSPLLAIVYETDPPRYFFVGDDSADLHFDAARLPHGWREHCKWIHFGGISLAREPLAGKLIALAEWLKEAGVRISYDPNFRAIMDQRYDATLRRMTELADVIKVSEEDLTGLFRTADIEEAFSTLRAWNPGATYLYTKGAQGASLHMGDRQWHASAPSITVVDSVGAGDASIAALAWSLLRTPEREPEQHLRFAVAAGAAACLSAGASAPSLAAVQELLGTRGVP